MTNLNEFQNSVSRNDKKKLMSLMFLPCLLIQRELNNDIWFLLNSGRYIMNYGIPHIEPFTIHSNMEFIMQQWLSSILFWTTYDNFGEVGLFILIMTCFALIVFLMFKLINLVTNDNFFISFTFTIIFTILIRSFMITRPIIFTILFIALELYSLELFITYKNNKYLIVLPVISVFMINLQAAMWPILYVMLLPYILDSFNFKVKFISGQGYEKRFFFFAIIVMILVGFINPYGIKSMTYLLSSYGYPEISNTVIEMKPININEDTGLFIFSYILINILIYCFYRNGKTKIRYFLLTLGTGIMALSSYRNFSFFILGSIISLSYYVKNVNLKINNDISPKVIRLRRVLIYSIAVVTLCAFFINKSNEEEDSEFNDLNIAVDYILHNEDISNIVLYTRYKDGGLTEFKGLPSYIDPRAEVFVKKNNNKDEIMKEYVDLQGGKLYYKLVLDKYNFSHLLVFEEDILNTYLPYDNDYDMIYSNESYKIFKKID